MEHIFMQNLTPVLRNILGSIYESALKPLFIFEHAVDTSLETIFITISVWKKQIADAMGMVFG